MKKDKNIKSLIRESVFYIPGARKLWTRWISGKRSIYAFNGWGMSTMTNPPWVDPADDIGKEFLKIHNEVLQAVLDKKIVLTQFQNASNVKEVLEGLMWRHFTVFWSAKFARNSGSTNLVECGVCDGLTIYFALSSDSNYKAWLYDAWEEIPGSRLLESEMGHAGDYGYLSISNTKNNLKKFSAEYIKGFIPESLVNSKKPNDVAWVHIDLNASKPTLDSLNEFYPKLKVGGIVLFDDYAGKGFTDTKKIVDQFFSNKKGTFLHMPTGQGIFFKQ